VSRAQEATASRTRLELHTASVTQLAIGLSHEYTVAVWVGRTEGTRGQARTAAIRQRRSYSKTLTSCQWSAALFQGPSEILPSLDSKLLPV
jgi:hypothetical protein